MENRVRELALFNLGIDSKLRGCDLVGLKVRDICHGDQVASRAMVMQHKTQRPVQFEITPATRDAVQKWIKQAGLLDPADYGTHSMRRTKATLIYRRTKNLRAVQLLLGHRKLESTVRYLGIEVDDALEISEQTESDRHAVPAARQRGVACPAVQPIPTTRGAVRHLVHVGRVAVSFQATPRTHPRGQ